MPKILLIDGDRERMEAIRQALVGAHYQVTPASSTSFALTTLEWDRPDLIVSHVETPDLDGYELCSIIRSDPKTKDVPFLLLTGPAGPIPGAPTRAGVDRVLGGSFTPADVVTSVRGLLHRSVKVLVVDDSLGVRRALELALQARQITVLSAALRSEAIECIERDHPDLVVSDVHLPDGNGYEICEFAKTRPGRRIPVILMSGAAEDAKRGARLKPDALIPKPFAPDELASRVERLLSRRPDPAR